MENFIKKLGNPTPKSVIEDLEQKYEIKFPKDLRKYYLKYGNSTIKHCVFEIDGFSFDVQEMVSINPEDSYTFSEVLECGRSDEWIPNNFYPFACNGGGDYYYWNSVNDYIYIIYDDDVDYPYEICKSVKEFFKLLEKSKKGL